MRKTRFKSSTSIIDKTVIGFTFIWVVIIALAVIGEIRCIYKAVTCDWDPIGKTEIIYTGATVTGLGAIIGWIDIEDSKEK